MRNALVENISWLWQPPVHIPSRIQHHRKATKRQLTMMSIVTFLARRFIAGQTLAQALDVVERFNRRGFLTTLDHLGEEVNKEAEAHAATDQYIAILKALKERGLDRNISIKLTQIGLSIDRELGMKNLTRIVKAAFETQAFVRVDMEGSAYTQSTLDAVRAVKTNATPVGATIQSMLKRSPEDLIALMEKNIPLRLCKGAYKEPSAIAYQKRDEIDRQFLDLAKRLLTAETYNGIATHDEDLIDAIKAYVKNNRIDRDSFEFQMLMGIRPAMQRRLLEQGWRVRVYIPFGRHWLPYMWRRLRERKENTLFLLKNAFRR